VTISARHKRESTIQRAPLRVIFCAYDHAGYVGGPNAWLRRLLPDLQADGLDVSALFITRSDPALCPTIMALRQAGVHCTCLPGQGYTTVQRVRWILGELAARCPDIFVPHLMVPAFYAARWARAAGIATIGVLHSDDAFHRAVLEEFVWGRPEYRLTALVCVSQYLAALAGQHQHGDTLIRTIPCGVPVPARSAAPAGDTLRLVYTGRFIERQKRISDLVRAVCRAVRAVPGTEACLYGSGPDQAAAQAALASEGLGLPVFIKAPIDSDLMQNELLACHAFVLVSDDEGLPISLMEAMACGLVPVCLHTASGVPELIIDGETGLLVPDRAASFIAAVGRLRQNPQLWQKLSQAARAMIISRFSHPQGLQSWLLLLNGLALRGDARTAIRVPDCITLPPVNPGLAREDIRTPHAMARLSSRIQRLYRQIRGGGHTHGSQEHI